MAIDLVAVLRLDDQLTSNLKSVAGVATAGFAAITAAAVGSVNQFVEFDTAIRKAGAVAGASAVELEALRESSLDLGASTSKSATEVANAAGELASAGFVTQDILGALPGVIAASEASGESLALAAETVGAALNIWSLGSEEAARVADILAQAANVSAADINDLGYAFKYAGAPAAALGIGIEETAAAIGILSNAGIDGSSAGTALRASLLALNNPAKAQAKLMQQIGFSVKDTNGDFRSLSGIVGALGDSLNGLAADEQVGILGKLVGTEAVSGVLALINAGSQELDTLTDSLRNSSGAADETAKQIMAGLGGSLEEASGAIETAAIRIGERLAPAIQVVADAVANANFDPIINAFGIIGDLAGRAATIVRDNWSSIAPILAPVVTIAAAVAASFLAIGGASAVFLAISTVVGFISGPVAAIALAVGVLGGDFAVLLQQGGPVKDFFDTLRQVLSGGLFTGILERDAGAVALALTIGNGIKNAFEKVTDFITTFRQLASGGLLTGVLERDQGAVAAAVNVFNGLRNTFQTFTAFVREKIVELTPAFESLRNTLTVVWETISSAFTSAFAIISPILSGLGSLLLIIGDYAVLTFNNILAPALAFAAQAFSTLFSIASPILQLLGAAFEAIIAVIKVLWENVLRPLVEFILGGVKNAFENLTDALSIVQGAFDSVSGVVDTVYGKIRDFASFLSTIKLPDFITKGVTASVDFVRGKLGAEPSTDGSHANGLSYVPYDGYTATLHKGEEVLTRAQADERRQQQASNSGGLGGISIAKLADQIIVREDADINRIADALVTKLNENRGGVTA